MVGDLFIIDDPVRERTSPAIPLRDLRRAIAPHEPDLFVRSYRNFLGHPVTVHVDLCGCTTLVQTWPHGKPPLPSAFAAPSHDH